MRVSRREKGGNVLIVHYYQPNHPTVNVSVTIDKSYRGYFQAPYCPSISGCRSIVKFENGDLINYEESRSILFQLFQNGKDIWLDYALFAPASIPNQDLLKSAPIDLSDDFLTKCASQNFYIEAKKSPFCDDSVFSLSTKYNNGAKPCDCNPDGSSNLDCKQIGGQCSCKENVIGRQCSRCRAGYYGFPDCKKCDCPSGNCNDRTGECICPQNVEEDDCTKCIPGTFGFHPHLGCDYCDCKLEGTINGNTTCNPESGQCDCKPNISGIHCESCKPGYWNYPDCQQCNCNLDGTIDSVCDVNGNCLCKKHLSDPNCEQCAQGTYNLDARNPLGCTKCFCFGLSDRCTQSPYFFKVVKNMNQADWTVNKKSGVTIETLEGRDGFRLRVDAQTIDKPNEPIYWIAPADYLGRKIYSYGGSLRYSIMYRSSDAESALKATVKPDLILNGQNQTLIHLSLKRPTSGEKFENSVDLLESQFVDVSNGLPATREQLMIILNNLNELRIRASDVASFEEAELYNVELDLGAHPYDEEADKNRPALSVERCACPQNHYGLSCESCLPGFYKVKGYGNSFSCVPCNCNDRAESCDEETGECIGCKYNTAGKHCESCKTGYYPIPYGNNQLECRLCPCPGPSDMNIFANNCSFDINANKVYYCNCLPGYTGQYCERCAPGYYGDPMIPGGKCLPCNCNNNIDMRDHGACDQRTGACLKCLHNTTGISCERCQDWHFGDPIVLKNCQPCKCDRCGSETCDAVTGDCKCKTNVKGFTCTGCAVRT